MPTPAGRRAAHELAPSGVLLMAAEITHADVAEPIRVVNDIAPLVLAGHEYQAFSFRVRLASERDGGIPTAEIVIDNVGRSLTRWLDASSGGQGASVRLMQVLVPTVGATSIEWEMTVDVLAVSVSQTAITCRLGYEALTARSAVTVRYDHQSSPGLF